MTLLLWEAMKGKIIELFNLKVYPFALLVFLCEICKLCLIYYSLSSEKHSYSRTSVARTLMARLPGLLQLVLESFGKYPTAADLGFRIIFFCILKMVY